MGHALRFDTHTYVKKLEKAGFNEEQAEAQAEALASVVDENLATKWDIKKLEQATKRNLKELERTIKELEQATKRDLRELELRIDAKLAELKADIIKWNVGTVFAAVGLFATIMKLLA